MRFVPLNMSVRYGQAPHDHFCNPIHPSPRLSVPETSGAAFRQVFSIGGVSFALNGDSASDIDGGDELEQFRRAGQECNFDVNIAWEDELQAFRGRCVFDSGATWKMFSSGDEFIFEFVTPTLGPAPYKQLRVDRGFGRAEVTLSRTALGYCQKISPVEYPVCELLITSYLAHRGLGVEVHGVGLVDSETGGHLFLGHSGAGKSTTARLWQAFRNPKILSDDRIILRLHDNELWMYGTPWHGEAEFALAKKARLDRIHILHHGESNEFTALSRGRAMAEIFARSFPPFYSPEGIGRTLEFLKRVLDAVGCYEFHFVPDCSSVAAVLNCGEFVVHE